MPIRRLDPLLVDRIAAGEVVERPAAAVKELIENALDAGARRIDVAIEAGGRALIRVADDGAGMDADDLALSVERHATSKIPDGDLAAIATLGFRGEALPSIASVSRLEIRSRAHGADAAFALAVEDGAKSALRPISHPVGTRVEARDLFAATPARLKFLKSDRSEAQASADVVRRLALASPGVRFSFVSDLGGSFDWPACPARRSGRARTAAPGARRRVRRRRAEGRGRARRRPHFRLGRPADLQQAERAYAIFLRQPPRGARPAAVRRLARRRARLHSARPPLRRGAVRRLRAERGRRQRPSCQSRSALPRQRAHPRAADRRGAPGLHGGGTSRQRQRRASIRSPRCARPNIAQPRPPIGPRA